ncbi:MAG TPA: TetR/AcrR family transcriptional regulator [Solirubrobacterales bacterium]|nr:TetR/AcrR family transcriptional regulator [Solirubrobacterales bacterium]
MSEHKNAGAEIRTPWGNASELRHRRLYPGSGTPPAEVARNQRERMFGAMLAVVSVQGYEATTVADVLALSGVSRSAFYRHFASKSECMVAAVSELLEPAIEALDPADRDGQPREPRQIFERFFRLLRSQPAAAQAYFVELHAVGAEGDAVGDRAVELLAGAIEDAWATRPDHGGPDPALTRALVGGLGKLIHTRLIRGDADELPDLAPDLWRWITQVSPPPGRLESPRRNRPAVGPTFQGYTPVERIAGAVASVVAENGYAQTSTDAIAARASISLSTFYAHFSDKQDAVLAALEMSGAQIMALAVPAARRAGDWTEGVRTLYEAICAYFSAEPAMAELALVGVYGAGPRACGRRDRVLDSLAAMLAPGFSENPAAPPIGAEAIGATVYALLRDRLRREGPENLAAVVPLATYITLVGFVGPERALAVANGRTARQ